MKGNTVSIKGTITADAEIKSTSNGKILALFSVVWNHAKKNQQTGMYEDRPHYFDVKVFLTERQAAFLEGNLVKGSQVAIIDAHLVQDRWQDQSGNNRSRVSLIVDDPIGGMLVTPRNTEPRTTAPAGEPEYVQASVYDEDIPF